MSVFVFAGLVLLIIEIFCYQGLKPLLRNYKFRILYVVLTIALLCYIGYGFSSFSRQQGQNLQSLFAMALVLLFYLPKTIFGLIILVEDFFRVGIGVFSWIKAFIKDEKIKEQYIPSRRAFISKVALGIAAVPFASVLHGITLGRYKFTLYNHIIEFDNLPSEFDGFKLTQISDIHVGSLDNIEKIEYAINLINNQDSDLLLFTGDMVNSLSTEMDSWYNVFSKIRSHTYGNYSILGNHDYGTYAGFDSPELAANNFSEICAISEKIGFKLLRNQHVRISKKDQSIVVLGLENWGAKMNFMQYGDLIKTSQGTTKEDFKIVMSHDPSHWDAQIVDNEHNYNLTLSGHTHGLQFGIEIPGFIKWSPIKYVYKQWAGLYHKAGRYLHVNRGFGYHAYSGRTGIWPEITVIELRKR